MQSLCCPQIKETKALSYNDILDKLFNIQLWQRESLEYNLQCIITLFCMDEKSDRILRTLYYIYF